MAEQELDRIIRRMSQAKVGRRGFLAGTGLAGLSAFIAACSGGSATASPSAASSSAPSSAPSTGASASAAPVETEGALYMFNWADYVDLDNIEAFKAKYKVSDFTYDTFASNEELLTRLQGGATGQWDVGAPTAEFVEAMVEGNFIHELDFSKIPNAAFINPQFQEFYKDDKAELNKYHLPKDWGTTGISIRTKVVTDEVKTWKQFFEVAPKYSGRIVIVDSPGDVFVAPLKALGYSLNSTDPKELGEARELLRGLAPHVLSLNSDTYDAQLASEECVLGLTWTGGIADLREEEETKDTVYQIPEDGTLYWMDTWVIFKDPPHPEAAHAFLNFIHEPAVQAKETETNRYATPNDEAMKLVPQAILDDPTIFVPESVLASGLLEGAQDVSTDPLRVEIWEEFKSSIGG
ncbi:MAG TPA: spermidine/putrescine ABC transporter substrate-binding protein [Candidatus Limnocylindrales bacterium]|nr:spermidine/putrescine ABC transporter substrate-binding protein [Candidatus Limnocylindrales bacterium]